MSSTNATSVERRRKPPEWMFTMVCAIIPHPPIPAKIPVTKLAAPWPITCTRGVTKVVRHFSWQIGSGYPRLPLLRAVARS